VIKLRKKVGNESVAERGRLLPTHRYTTVAHQFRQVAPIVDGRYLRAETQQAALAAAAGLPMTALEPVEAATAEPAPAPPSGGAQA